jgi:hypothetical protein
MRCLIASLCLWFALFVLHCGMAFGDNYYHWTANLGASWGVGASDAIPATYYTEAEAVAALRGYVFQGRADWQYVQPTSDPTVYEPIFPKADIQTFGAYSCPRQMRSAR